jgi:hypothetical protein
LDSIFDVKEQSCIPKSCVGLDPEVCRVCQVTGDASCDARCDARGEAVFVEMKCKTTAIDGTDGSTFKKAEKN